MLVSSSGSSSCSRRRRRRRHGGCLVGFLAVAIVILAPASSAAEQQDESLLQEDDLLLSTSSPAFPSSVSSSFDDEPPSPLPEFMMTPGDDGTTTKKSSNNLRASALVPNPNSLMEEHLRMQATEKRLTNLDKLSAPEKYELMGDLKDSMVRVESIFDGIDMQEVGQETSIEIQQVATMGKDYTTKVFEVVDEAMGFVSSMIYPKAGSSSSETEEQPEEAGIDHPQEEEEYEFKEYEEEITLKDILMMDDFNVTANASAKATQIARRLNMQGNKDSGSGSDYKKQHHKTEYERFREKNHRHQRRHAKQKFTSQFQHRQTHHQRKMDAMHEAVLNGDMHGAFAAFNFGGHHNQGAAQGNHHAHAWTDHERRLKANRERRLNKREQCDLLADCVLRMSLYDTFVYFFSDDIDPGTGEVDDNLIKFNEGNIRHEYWTARDIAKKIKNKMDGKLCNNLLQRFHRTIEHGEIPEWEGASINQVCLAEGTTVYVQFQEMALALVDHSFPHGHNKVTVDKWVKDTDKFVDMVEKHIAVEPFRCAEELFYKGPRKDKKEEFPFGGCGGKNTHQCSIDKYVFPKRVLTETSKNQATVYEGMRKRVKCDPGYEIKTKSQCIQAGLSIGGSLRDGKIVEGDWGHEPCGCFIWNDGAIHWNRRKWHCQNHGWDSTVVCKERRIKDDYEIVQYSNICKKDHGIRTRQECEMAAQRLGGMLHHNWGVAVGKWGHISCGCSIEWGNNKIHWNENWGKCHNGNHYRYQPVCKRNKNPPYYKVHRKRNKCDPGLAINSRDECIRAAKKMGGVLRHGKLIEGTWGHTPCGCFIQHNDKAIHWKKGGTCANHHWDYDVVCKPEQMPYREKYARVHYTNKCESGYEINNVRECEIAGQALGGYLPDSKHVEAHNWGHTPCGCFLDLDGNIRFDTSKDNCKQNSAYESVCLAKQEKGEAGRDEFGKLLSNDDSGFETVTQDMERRTANSCVIEKKGKIHDDCMKQTDNKQNTAYYKCRVEKMEETIKECDRFGAMQTGLELVFGMQTSPGFICGIKEAIVNDGVPMPGSCCLDAPYELDGDAWGQPFQCDSKCKNPGPFLAGVNKDACDAHGGTWCPSKSNCSVLKKCVADLVQEAREEKRTAFEKYLSESPEIKDPTDRTQCQVVRNYFGFDDNFINDKQICEDVEQMKYANDFDFLKQFFKQGSDVANTGDGKTPALPLIPPDRSDSEDPAVTGHDAWAGVIFALKAVSDALEFVINRLSDLDCPCDPLCVSQNICQGVKGGLIAAFTIIFQLIIIFINITENLFELLSDPEAQVRAFENTEVIFENMQLMADYLVEMRTEIRDRDRRRDLQMASFGMTSPPPIDVDGDDESDESAGDDDSMMMNHTQLAKKIYASAAFDVKLKVVNKDTTPLSLVALATLNGVGVATDYLQAAGS